MSPQCSPISLLELAPHKLDWIRTASDLLAELTAWAGKRVTASPGWPKTPRSLSVALRRIAPQMRMHGVSIMFLKTPEKRFIEIISTKPLIPEEPHVSVGGIERCSDELIHGDPDPAQIQETASRKRRKRRKRRRKTRSCVVSLRPRRSRLHQPTRTTDHPPRATRALGDGEFGAPKRSERLREIQSGRHRRQAR